MNRAVMGLASFSALTAFVVQGLEDETEEPFIEVTGGGPEDNRVWKAWRVGNKPYQFRVRAPGVDFSMDYRYTPLAVPMLILGQMSDRYRFGEREEKLLSVDNFKAATYSTLPAFADLGSMSGMNRIVNMFSTDEWKRDKSWRDMTASLPTMAIPNIFRWIDSGLGTKYYKTDSISAALQARIPFVPKINLLPMLDIMGEEIGSDITDGALWDRILSSTDEPPRSVQWMVNQGVGIFPFDKRTFVNGVRVTDEEAWVLNKKGLPMLHRFIERYIDSRAWVGQDQEAINDALDSFKGDVKDIVTARRNWREVPEK